MNDIAIAATSIIVINLILFVMLVIEVSPLV